MYNIIQGLQKYWQLFYRQLYVNCKRILAATKCQQTWQGNPGTKEKFLPTSQKALKVYQS